MQAALLGAIAYFILPFDFMPDMLPVLGFTDDAAVLATAIRMVAGHITPEHRDAARAALKRGIDDRWSDGLIAKPAPFHCASERGSGFSIDAFSLALRRRVRSLRPCVLLGFPGLELLEQRFLVGVRLARLPRSPGSVSGIHRTWRASPLRRCGS